MSNFDVSLQEYYDMVVNAFQSWIDDHYDYETWASYYRDAYSDLSEALAGCDDGMLENDYIGWFFNWKQAAIDHEISHYEGVYCPNCEEHIVYEYGYSPYCECDGEDYEEMSEDDIREYLNDIGDILVSEGSLESALEEAFEEYVDALESSFGGVCEDIQEGLKRLTEYDDVLDLMATLLYVTTVYHASGNLMEDRSDIDTDLIDQVRNNGLNSVWTREEIEGFMSEMEL